MQLHRLAGPVAGFLCLAALAATPAAAAGPTVTVRVEGENRTLLERTQVTLSGNPVPGHTGNCDGNSVGAALEAALGADWDRAAGGYVTTLAGESHDYSRSDYWAEWLDTGSGYKRGNGVCDDDVADGDEVLMLVDIPPYGEGSTTEVPLSLRDVPAAVQRGSEITVRVVGAVTTTPYGDAGDGADRPVAGATVDRRRRHRDDGRRRARHAAPRPVRPLRPEGVQGRHVVLRRRGRSSVSDAPPPPAPAAAPPGATADTAAPVGAHRGHPREAALHARGAPRAPCAAASRRTPRACARSS